MFGPFSIEGANQALLSPPTQRAGELIARLALGNHQPIPRVALAHQIWWNKDSDPAQQSLRKALSLIRKSIGPDLVEADDRGLRLGPKVQSDIAQASSALYRAQVAASDEDVAQELIQIRRTTESNLLEGWNSPWIDPFREDWLQKKRSTLIRLSDILSRRDQNEAALQCVEQAALSAPNDEGIAARILSRLSDLCRFTEAETFYRQFSDRLEAEYDLSPSPSLVAVFRNVRRASLDTTPTAEPRSDVLGLIIDKVFEQEPGKLVDLLVSEGLSWTVFLHAGDFLPVMVKALQATTDWTDARKRLAIDTIQLANFTSRYEITLEWAPKLREASPKGSYEDIVCDCLEVVASPAAPLAEILPILDAAHLKAEKIQNEYLSAVVLSEKARLLMEGALYQEALQVIQENKGKLQSSSTQRGQKYLSFVHGMEAETHFLQGRLQEARESIEHWWAISSVADVGGFEDGYRSLYGLIRLKTSEDTTGSEMVNGLAACIRQKKVSTTLRSMLHITAGLQHLGRTTSAHQMAATYLSLSSESKEHLSPLAIDYLNQYAASPAALKAKSLFETRSMPSIAGWVRDQFTATP